MEEEVEEEGGGGGEGEEKEGGGEEEGEQLTGNMNVFFDHYTFRFVFSWYLIHF